MMHTRIPGFAVLAVWMIAALPPQGEGAEGALGPLSDSEIQMRVEEAPSGKERPELDALVLFEGIYISYDEGMAAIRRQRLIKIYTEWAIDHLGDPRLAYDEERQELEIHASRTYLPDGSTMDTPDNGYNEVTPRGLDLSLDHLSLREMVVSHVGVEREVSILLDYSVQDVSACDLAFNRMFLLHDDFPALEKEVVARGDLRGETVNPAGGLFTLPSPDRQPRALVWRVKNLPARPRHAGHRLKDQVPWVAIAAVSSWEALLGDLGMRVDAATLESSSMEAMLEDLEEDTPSLSDREALERLAKTAKDRTALVRYRPWTMTPLPRPVNVCLERSTATPVERSALLLAGCRVLNLEASLILPVSGTCLSQDVPVLEAMGDPLLHVEVGQGDALWIDPVGGTVSYRPPIAGGFPFFAIGGAGVERARIPVSPSRVLVSVFWDLEAGEAKAEGVITGQVAKALDWGEPEKLLRGWAEGWCDSAEVTDLKVLTASPEGLSYALSLKAPLPSPDDRGRTLVQLPMPPAGISELLPEGMDLGHSETDGILFPAAPVDVDLTWKIRVPDAPVLLPGPNIDMVWEDVSLTVTRAGQGSLIETGYRLDSGGRPVIPQEYAGYRSIFLEATDPRLTRMVFAEEGEG